MTISRTNRSNNANTYKIKTILWITCNVRLSYFEMDTIQVIGTEFVGTKIPEMTTNYNLNIKCIYTVTVR